MLPENSDLPSRSLRYRSRRILTFLTLLGTTVALTACHLNFGPLGPFTSSGTTTTAAPTVNSAVTAKNIYSIDLGNQSVDVYAANLNGTASPASSYPGGALAVTGDSAGTIYIGTYSATLAAVQVYAAGSTTASRSITVATAASNAPQINTLAVDSASNLYVAMGGAIYVYGPTASGAATPIRTIAGALTTLDPARQTTQMAFDSSDNLFAVTAAGYTTARVVEFPAGATGNIAPTIITSSAYFPSGVALDSAGNIYVSQSAYTGSFTAGVYVFAKGSVAGAAPIRTIAGSSTYFGFYSDNIFLDSAGNIFVGVVSNGQTDFLVFPATANGNVAPASILVRSRGSTTDSQFFVR